jgi:hypothetical protein
MSVAPDTSSATPLLDAASRTGGVFIAHLDQWNREVADMRVHETIGELFP